MAKSKIFPIFPPQYIFMRKISLDSTFEEYESLESLPQADQLLVDEAKKAADDAYAPYSHFHVGAAVLLDNGKVIRGNNQENAAYPSGLCAERVAFFATGAQHPGEKIKAIAITAYPEGKKLPSVPVSPCGDCRQVMAEYEHRYGQNIRLIMEAGNGKYIVSESVKNLLPFLFSADSML
jgi:cytidine deaminase